MKRFLMIGTVAVFAFMGNASLANPEEVPPPYSRPGTTPPPPYSPPGTSHLSIMGRPITDYSRYVVGVCEDGDTYTLYTLYSVPISTRNLRDSRTLTYVGMKQCHADTDSSGFTNVCNFEAASDNEQWGPNAFLSQEPYSRESAACRAIKNACSSPTAKWYNRSPACSPHYW